MNHVRAALLLLLPPPPPLLAYQLPSPTPLTSHPGWVGADLLSFVTSGRGTCYKGHTHRRVTVDGLPVFVLVWCENWSNS